MRAGMTGRRRAATRRGHSRVVPIAIRVGRPSPVTAAEAGRPGAGAPGLLATSCCAALGGERLTDG